MYSNYLSYLLYNILPCKPIFYFVSVKSYLETKFLDEMKLCKNIETLNKLYHYKNYALSAIFRTKLQRKEFVKMLKKYDMHILEYEFERIEFMNYQIYNNVYIDIIKNVSNITKEYKQIKLDDIDLMLLEKLSNGYGRESILNLSFLLDVNYHILLYKFKRLVRNDYFLKFVAQPNVNLTQNDMALLRFKDMEIKNIVRKLNQLKTVPYLIKFSNNNYLIQILSTSFNEYKETLGKIVELFEDELINFQVFNLKENIILNQYPFEYLLKKSKSTNQVFKANQT